MEKKIITLCILFQSYFISLAGNETFSTGGRSAAMGNTSVIIIDPFSSFNNQAGLAGVENISIGVCTERKFMLASLQQHGFVLAIPTSSGTFGLTMNYFGYSTFKENKVGIGFGKKINDKFFAGVQLDYLFTSITEYGTKSNFTFEAGIIAKITKELILGIHLYNPLRPQLSEYLDKVEKSPTIMKIGIAYEVSKKIIIAVETEKDIDEKAILKAGIEYKIIDKFCMRMGISTNPVINSFGIGLNMKNIKIDIASVYHPLLGMYPSISLCYVFD